MRVTLIAAQSIDGFITRHDESGTAFTSAADKAYFTQVLAGFDCSVMGSTTYRTIRDMIRRQPPSPRRRVVLTRRPDDYAYERIADLLEFRSDSPETILARFSEAGCSECALLGGSQIHHLFLDHDLVDRVWLTLEPRLFGRGTPFVAGEIDVRLSLESFERLSDSDSLLVKYQVNRR